MDLSKRKKKSAAAATTTSVRRLGRPPKVEGKDSRTLILAAALDLFSTVGYEATTVRQIAARVGVRDPALYGHFKSKADIREQLFEIHGPRALFSALEKVDLKQLLTSPREFARDRLHNVAARWFEPSEHKFFRFLLMENLKSNVEPSLSLAEIQTPMREKLTEIARWLILFKIAIKADPVWFVGQFLGPIQTLRTEVAFSGEKIDLEQVKKRLDLHLDHFVATFLPNLSLLNFNMLTRSSGKDGGTKP